MLGTLFSGLKWESCLVYLVDVLVLAVTFEEQQHSLRLVLEANNWDVKKSNLKNEILIAKYCDFNARYQRRSIPYPEKMADVSGFWRPADRNSLRCFLGLAAY